MPSGAAWPHPLAAPDRARRGSRTRHRRRRRRASPGAARPRGAKRDGRDHHRPSLAGSGRSAPGAARPRRDRHGLPAGVSDGSVVRRERRPHRPARRAQCGRHLRRHGDRRRLSQLVDDRPIAVCATRHRRGGARRQRLRLRRRKRAVAARRHRPRRSEQRAHDRSSPICRPRAPTRPPRRSAAPRTSSAATPARAGSTRSSRTAPATRRAFVAHLPKTLRYAAVTAVGKTLVIAGGSLENGTAERQRARFRPGDTPRHEDRHPPRPDHARRGSDARQRRLRDRRPRRDDRNADDRDRRRRRRPQAGARRGAPEDRPLRPGRRHARLAHHRRRREGHRRHRRDRLAARAGCTGD